MTGFLYDAAKFLPGNRQNGSQLKFVFSKIVEIFTVGNKEGILVKTAVFQNFDRLFCIFVHYLEIIFCKVKRIITLVVNHAFFRNSVKFSD